MNTLFTLNKEKTLYIFISSLLFIYLIIRAYYVPFTHDEASTFFRFVQPHSLAPEFSREALNNHFVNTILTYFSYIIFGSSKIALRLPNLLISLLYYVFVYMLAQFLNRKGYRWGFIVMMLFTHFFVEFFAVSRGYGMSMAFFIATFYYLMKAIKTNNLTNHIYVSLFSLLMVAANINMVIPSIAIVIFQVFQIFFQRKNIPSVKKWIIPSFLFISFITISSAFLYLTKLKEYDAFYLVPENAGFLDSTVITLMNMLTGASNIFGLTVLLFLFAIMIFIASRQLINQKLNFLFSVNSIFLFVLLTSIIGIFLVVILLDVNYPEDRVAMYFFPLVIGSLFFVLDSVKSKKYRFLYLILIPLLFFPVHFMSSINVSYVNGYIIEAIPQRFYEAISSEHKKNNVMPTIGGSNMRQFAWTYINFINGGDENTIDWAGYPDTVSDFQILETNRYPFNLNSYDSIDYANYSNLTIYKRKKQVPKTKVEEINIYEPKCIIGNEYYNLLEIDSISNKGYYFEFNVSIISADIPFTSWLVIQVVNNKNKTVVYKYIPFNWLKDGVINETSNFSQSIFLDKIPEDAYKIKIYIWNKDKKTFTLNSAHIDIFEIKR